MRQSIATGNDRNVLLALADCAWRDGVTWILVGDDKDDEAETICRLARVSRKTAWRSVQSLIEMGDLQTVKVRRGRSFVIVYRVVHGAVDVDYERIPFDLPHRFDESAAPVQHGRLTRSALVASEGRSTSGIADPVEVQHGNLTRSDHDSTCHDDGVQRVISTRFNVSDQALRVKDEPKENRKENLSSSTPSEGVDPAAALPDRHLTDLGVAPSVRRAALDEPERAKAWLELAATQATRNPGGFFVSCFTAGGFPSKRVDDRQTANASRREWVEQTSWRLDAEHAHLIVDDWRDLDDVERQEFHELVDRERASREEASAA
ncbi:MAG: hypothetical protein ACREJX_00715 [Polyangiaceae bacterium]